MLFSTATVLAGNTRGRIEGQIILDDGRPLGGVRVTVTGHQATALTDEKGLFVLKKLPVGSLEVAFRFGRNETSRSVNVIAGETTAVDVVVDWSITLETVTVVSPSRYEESIMEAPAAVTRVPEEEIKLEAADGMVFKLLEFTPGAEITQSGLYNSNFNTRGFNDTVNGRLEVRVDGRDVRVPDFGTPPWSRITLPFDDLLSVEFLRGPSSALYGANAAAGVVNLQTKAPRESQGGAARLTAGELDSTNVDFRWAGALGNDWYVKVLGAWRKSDDFTVSRGTTSEYSVLCTAVDFVLTSDCLLPEPTARPLAGPEITSGSLRLDKYLSDGSFLTFEGGTVDSDGIILHTGAGRNQFLGDKQPWARIAYSRKHWDIFTSYAESDSSSIGLSSGVVASGKSTDLQARIQTDRSLIAGKVRLVVGAEFQQINVKEGVNRVDPATGERVKVDEGSMFGQIDWDIGKRLTLVTAARLDESSIHDLQFSPKVAMIYRPTPAQSLRFTFNRGFRVSAIVGLAIDTQVAQPEDLQSAFCDPAGVDCGLASTPVLLVGNNNLNVEESSTFEIGYRGVLGKKTMLTIDAYHSKLDNFLWQNILPQLGTSLGRLNEDFGPWVGPASAENTPIDPADCPAPAFSGGSVADCVRLGVPTLSNKFDGSSAIIALTFPNLGDVEATGVDIGLQYSPTNRWNLAFSYSWFDSEFEQNLPDLEQVFTPNTPENKLSFGVGYSRRRLDARLNLRWVDEFRWVGGLFQGTVESYTTVDLNAAYALDFNWRVGINVSNVLDNDHYEVFGGNLLGRRALANVTYSW